jgi:hypothetical protein
VRTKKQQQAVLLGAVEALVHEEPGRQPIMYFADAARELIHQERVVAERLDDHLVHDHGRLLHEITGLPLPAVHELEHFDESLGLLALHHSHTA